MRDEAEKEGNGVSRRVASTVLFPPLTFDIKWIAPVRIGAHHDAAYLVEGPRQALEVLNDNWPVSGAKHHKTALRECNLACTQVGRAEKSREAFMAAALEAGVLLNQREEKKQGLPASRAAKGDLPTSYL